jgi:hypothetical protein
VSLSKSNLYMILTIFPFIMNNYMNGTLFENVCIFLYILCSLLGSCLYSWLFPPNQRQKSHISFFQMCAILFLSVAFLSMIVSYDSMFFLCFIISGVFSYVVIPIGEEFVFC